MQSIGAVTLFQIILEREGRYEISYPGGVDSFELAFKPIVVGDPMFVKDVQVIEDTVDFMILTDNDDVSSQSGEFVAVPSGKLTVDVVAVGAEVEWVGSFSFIPENVKDITVISAEDGSLIAVSNFSSNPIYLHIRSGFRLFLSIWKNSLSHTPYQPVAKIKNLTATHQPAAHRLHIDLWRHCNVKMMSPWQVISQLSIFRNFRKPLFMFFKFKKNGI